MDTCGPATTTGRSPPSIGSRLISGEFYFLTRYVGSPWDRGFSLREIAKCCVDLMVANFEREGLGQILPGQAKCNCCIKMPQQQPRSLDFYLVGDNRPTLYYIRRGRGIRSNETPRISAMVFSQQKSDTAFRSILSRRRYLMIFFVLKKTPLLHETQMLCTKSARERKNQKKNLQNDFYEPILRQA